MPPKPRVRLHTPSAENPFVTQSMLPADSAPPAWPIGVTQVERDALDKADSPSTANPVVTYNQWQAPRRELRRRHSLPRRMRRPRRTRMPHRGLNTGSCDLSDDQCAAIKSADVPSIANPFVTQSKLPMLPADPAPPAWPIGLTPRRRRP